MDRGKQKKDPFLRSVGLPLTAIMHTAQDLVAMKSQKNIILHLDATGSIVRRPQDLDCKRIYYFCILARHEVEIIKLTHMITSEHTTASIGNLLSVHKNFVLEQNKKWPFAKIIVVDQAWASINAII